MYVPPAVKNTTQAQAYTNGGAGFSPNGAFGGGTITYDGALFGGPGFSGGTSGIGGTSFCHNAKAIADSSNKKYIIKVDGSSSLVKDVSKNPPTDIATSSSSVRIDLISF